MDKPLLRLNTVRLQYAFSGRCYQYEPENPVNTRLRERRVLHLLSSGSCMVALSNPSKIIVADAEKTVQGRSFWAPLGLGKFNNPYPSDNFNWEVLYE